MRKKPNLIPRMELCARVQEKFPEEKRGRWLTGTPFRELRLELGCGKGRFTVETARENPDVLLAAIERVPSAMVVGMERACAAELSNVLFLDRDVKRLSELFAPGEVARIYLNFSDPWPRNRDRDRRLTAPGFLALYRSVLAPGGTVEFKTDNVPLFDFSLRSFEKCGWALTEVTRDLHANGQCGVMTDYEAKFYEQGVKICRCVASPPEEETRA
jgi:tRNA (guanine-N7-)-methyltransferase